MADIVSAEKRSQMMAGIRSKNTKPEIALRSLLHRNGYRFRVHGKWLPGRPDLVLPKWNAVIFVHGCYWHGHENCELFRLPKSRQEFWSEKIAANRKRDEAKEGQLIEAGWKVIIVWECAVSKKLRLDEEELLGNLGAAFMSSAPRTEICGR